MNIEYILAVGTVGDGYSFVGPFKEKDDAIRYAKIHYVSMYYSVVKLYPLREV